MKISYRDETGYIRRVRAAGAEGAQVEIEFDRRAMSFSHPMMGNQTFDSDSGAPAEDNNSMSLVAAPWVGKKLMLTVAPDNGVQKMEGFKELLEAIDNSALGDQLYENLRSGFTEEQIGRSMHSGLFDVYPDKPVQVGDTWTRTVRNPAPQLGTLEITYQVKLAAVEERAGRKVAVLEYKAETKLLDAAEGPMGKAEMKSSKGEGTTVVDVESGMPLANDAKGVRELVIRGPAQGDQPGPELQINGKVSSHMKVMSEAERGEQKEANRKAAAVNPEKAPS
jgi:hypothetical protein